MASVSGKKMTTKESNKLLLDELKVTYKLTDSVLVAILVGYADEVQVFLDTPSRPGTVPISFAQFIRKLDEAFKRDDETQTAKAEKKRDSNLQTLVMDDIVVEADVKAGDDTEAEDEIEIEEFEAIFELDEKGKEMEQHLGQPFNGKKLQVLWENSYKLANGYQVKLSVKTSNQIIGVAELIDENNRTCSRLKPRVDKLRGDYLFSWKHLRIRLTIM